MRNIIVIVAITLNCAGFIGAQVKQANLKKHMNFLADDKLKGRDVGSKEIEIAATYIEKEFKKIGLEPKGTNGYRQQFEAKFKRKSLSDSVRLAENLIGFIDNGAAKTIVIGAHYDHIGLGYFASRDTTKRGEVHNGADDNASGICGVIEMARYFAKNKVKEGVNFLFIAFSAEELGLLGSDYFVKNPTIDLNSVKWMMNMDMIGRFTEEKGLALIGFGSSDNFEEIVREIPTDMKINKGLKCGRSSDQWPFYNKEIPVLFLHTGGHNDYHKPSDDVDLIDFEKMKVIVEYGIQLIIKSIDVREIKFNGTHG